MTTFEAKQEPERDMRSAMTRGVLSRCPACGRGSMFRAFLKVADNCPACGEDLSHQRADDAPAYFVILIVGHIIVPLVLAFEIAMAPPYWLHLVIWLPLTLALSLLLLQPMKGAIVAWQWTNRMHGFDGQGDEDEVLLRPRPADGLR